MDIGITFITAIPVGAEQERDLIKISQRYMRMHGLFDVSAHGPSLWIALLALVPIHVAVLSGMPPIAVKLSSFTRLLRVEALAAWFTEKEKDVHFAVQKIAIFKFILAIFGVSHWIGCLWWWVASWSDFDESTWISQYLHTYPPEELSQYHMINGTAVCVDDGATPDKCLPFWFQYHISLFWGFLAMTNFGYVDIVPGNFAEIATKIGVSFVQMGFYAYILGTLFHYVVHKDEERERTRQRHQNLEAYGQARNLPAALCARLRRHFANMGDKNEMLEHSHIEQELPNVLVAKIANFQHRALINSSPLFLGAPEQYLTMLAVRLKPKLLLPGELLYKKGDMSREMGFIKSGSVDVFEDPELRKLQSTIEHGCVGETAFFMGIVQPFAMTACTSSDVILQTISKEAYEEILDHYSEGHAVVSNNLLHQYGLDRNGEEILAARSGSGSANKKDSGKSNSAGDGLDELKSLLQATLRKRKDDALSAMIDASGEGDIDEIKRILHQETSLDVNTGDYDARTMLHLSAAEGNTRVVQALLVEGADVHCQDRWGATPLHDAVAGSHTQVIELLSAHGAELHYEDPAGMLCGAAAEGDLDKMRQLIGHGVSPNACDYDGRTALHLAACEGIVNVIEFLIQNRAEVNVVDRWNNTPLDDAVKYTKELPARLLYEHGGKLNLDFASGSLCEAAAEGDLLRLKLLYENGTDVRAGDYDRRTALHLASAEGQLVSVDFLLSVKAEVNYRDRWGGTALDDALNSGHHDCAKILIGQGGQSTKPITAEQQAAIDQISFFDMHNRIRDEVAAIQMRRRVNLQLKSLVKALQPDLETAQNRFARLVKILSDLSGQLLHKGGHEALVAATTHPEEELFKLPKPKDEQDDDAVSIASAELGSNDRLDGSRSDGSVAGSKHNSDGADEGMAPMMRIFLQDQITEFGASLNKTQDGQLDDAEQDSKWPDSDVGERQRDRHDSYGTDVGRQRERHESYGTDVGKQRDRYDSYGTDVGTRTPPALATPKHGSEVDKPDASVVPIEREQGLTLRQRRQSFRDGTKPDALPTKDPMEYRADTFEQTNDLIMLMQNTRTNAGKSTSRSFETVKIVSFNQLILMFPVVERGFALLRSEFDRIARTDLVTAFRGEERRRTGLSSESDEEQIVDATTPLNEPRLAMLLRQLRLDAQDVDIQRILTQESGRNDAAEGATFAQLATDLDFHRLVALRAEHVKGLETPTDAQHAELITAIWRACAILNDSFDLMDSRKKGVLTIDEVKVAVGGEQGLSDVLSKLMAGKQTVKRVDFLLCMLQWGDVIGENELVAVAPDSVERAGRHDGLQGLRKSKGKAADARSNSSKDAGVKHKSDTVLVRAGEPVSFAHATEVSLVSSIASAFREAYDVSGRSTSPWRLVRWYSGARSLAYAIAFDLRQCILPTPIEDMLFQRLVETRLDEELEHFFNYADFDNSGELDHDEFMFLLEKIKLAVPRHHMKRLFNYFARHEVEKESVITFEDFQLSIARIKARRSEQRRNMERKELVHSMDVGVLGRYVIIPGSKVHQWWNLSKIVIAVYYITAVPYVCAFLRYEEPVPRVVVVPMYIADGALWLNILREFFTAFTNQHSVIVRNIFQIREHYLKGDFFYDLLSVLPLDVVVWLVGGRFASVSWVRSLRMLRFRDVMRKLKSVSDDLHTTPIRAELTSLAVFVSVMFHWTACLWYIITVPKTSFAGGTNWVTRVELEGYGSGNVCAMDGKKPTWIICALSINEYMLCLDWVVGQLTTIGAGDLQPQDTRERVFTIFLLVLNLSFFAYVLGAISNLFMSADEHLVETRREITSVEQYIASKHLPIALQDEVRDIFEFKSRQVENGVSEAEETAIFRGLSQSLQVEVAQYIGRKPIARTQTFKGCDDNFLDILSTHLREVTVPPGAVLYNTNDISKQLHIIFSGVVELVVRDSDTGEEVVDGRHTDGDVLAPLPFFFNVRHTHSARTALNNSVRLFVLERDNYRRLIKLYPDEEEVVSHNVLLEEKPVSDNKSARSGTSKASGMSGLSGINSLATGDDDKKSMAASEISHLSKFENKQRSSITKAITQARKKKENERVCAMCQAAFEGNLNELKSLLAGGDISINAGDYDLRTSFHLAASEGHLHIIEWLMEIEADPSVKDRYGNTPMADAVRHKRDEVIDLLRAHGEALESDDAASLLCIAASKGDVDQLRRLIDSRVDVNAADYDKRCAMALAASEGHIECIEFLISRFANINPVDRWKGTPLTDAIRHKHLPVQALLRKHGATLPTSDDMACQLCELAYQGNTLELAELVRNGVDINLGDYDDRRALHLACCEGHLGTTEFLLTCNTIDVNVVDRLGGTPLEDAHREGHVAVIALLTKFGALRSLSPALAEKLQKRDEKARERDAEKKSELAKAQRLHSRQASVQAEMSRLSSESVELFRLLQEQLEAMTLTLHHRGSKTAKAFKLCPKPSLDETMQTFGDSFSSFMKRHHAQPLLACYLACQKFELAATYDALFAIHEEYVAPGAKHALNLPPRERDAISDALDDEKSASNLPPTLLVGVVSFLDDQLERYNKRYHKSREFKTEYLSPLGRLWRVLKLARNSTESTRRLENEVLNQLTELAADETIVSLFGEASTVSQELRGVVESLTKQCAEGRDLARRAAAGLKVQYRTNLHRRNLMDGGNGGVKKKKTRGSKAGSKGGSTAASSVISGETGDAMDVTGIDLMGQRLAASDEESSVQSALDDM